RVGHVHDQDPWMGMRARVRIHVSARIAHSTRGRSVGAVTYVDVMVEDGQGGVHAPSEEGVRPHDLEVRTGPGGPSAGPHADVSGRWRRSHQDEGEDREDGRDTGERSFPATTPPEHAGLLPRRNAPGETVGQ